MKKITIAITEELERELEKERKDRRFESVPEVVRVILSDYFRNNKN
ncbi:MAG: ribbon-helix-helix protein, CopG family [Patescibacteria group bacterium]|nr:ribbon-helix-helix protein, CopG family [Patescibacteria group bacterium]